MLESEADEAKIHKLHAGDFSDDDAHIQHYVFCMMFKGGLISQDGRFQKEVAMAKITNDDQDKEAIGKAIDTCTETQGKNPHESAWLIAKCLSQWKIRPGKF